MQRTDQKDDILLCSGEIPTDNVDDSNHAAHYAHIEPPKDPTVHPYMDMHNFLLRYRVDHCRIFQPRL